MRFVLKREVCDKLKILQAKRGFYYIRS